MKKLVKVDHFVHSIWEMMKPQIVEKEHDAIKMITESPIYIPPLFKEIREIGQTPYILISAPGAVGKTTLAQYLAHTKKAFYWDLSKLKLGDGSFLGVLAEYFGSENLPRILDQLLRGEISILIDAFDEAEIISGWEGVEKFLRDLHKFCKNSKRPHIVFFSRSETAELIQLTLEDLEGLESYGMFEIDYFDEMGARKFIEYHLENNEDIQFKQHPIPYKGSVDLIFQTIANGLENSKGEIWDSDIIRSFLGYAPVLQTIASYLNGANYNEVNSKLTSSSGTQQGVKVIANFVEELLLREQKKMANRINELSRGISLNMDEIYTPEEQIAYISQYIGVNNTFAPKVPDNIPNSIKSDYIESVINFLPNHPFIRKRKFSSPAFRDFILGELLSHEKLENFCLAIIKSRKFALTPLFAFFYAQKNNNCCKGSHAGFIYESACAKQGYDQNHIQTLVKESSEKKYLLEIFSEDQNDPNNIILECNINNEQPLTFVRRLSNAIIEIDGPIVLGSYEPSIELSEVEIISDKITLSAKELIFASKNEGRVVLKSNKFESPDFNFSISKKGSPHIAIDWPGAEAYPWSDYKTDISLSDFEDVRNELYSLKRILMPFRKHGRDTWARFKPYIDDKIVGGSSDRKKMLEYLLEEEILVRKPADNKYFLEEDSLNNKGINWGDLRNLKYNQALKEMLLDFKHNYN